MRCMERNKQTFWYSLYSANTVRTDANGNRTGELIPIYSSPVEMRANIRWASGNSNVEPFGTLEQYDRVIVTDNMDCPIDENAVLYVDCGKPEYDQSGTQVVTPFDYVVRRVAKSLNSISIAISKVKATR